MDKSTVLPMAQVRRILVTGASGYVGGRLVRALLGEKMKVQIFVRDKQKVAGQPWIKAVEVSEGNASNYEDTLAALKGVHTAFYLLHSIGVGSHFDEIEAAMADSFSRACQAAGVSQIVYLGGIANDKNASKHHPLLHTSLIEQPLQMGYVVQSPPRQFVAYVPMISVSVAE